MTADLAEQLLAVVTEGVSNAVRHAQADKINVGVSASGGVLSVTVNDDGRGIGNPHGTSGLANMEARALNCNGVFRIESDALHGTKFHWSVPLDLQSAAPLK